MACEAVPACTMGAAAKAYVFPTESVTELAVAVESFQPTTTTFRFPAVCAPAYVTVTEVNVPCGVAELVCTKEIADTAPTVKITPLLGRALTVKIGRASCRERV